MLSSGGEASATHAAAAARAQRLYVGGIPPPPTLPNIPNSVSIHFNIDLSYGDGIHYEEIGIKAISAG